MEDLKIRKEAFKKFVENNPDATSADYETCTH